MSRVMLKAILIGVPPSVALALFGIAGPGVGVLIGVAAFIISLATTGDPDRLFFERAHRDVEQRRRERRGL